MLSPVKVRQTYARLAAYFMKCEEECFPPELMRESERIEPSTSGKIAF